MTIEKTFDVALTASLALQEKQIQQNYRPYIAVHKWFARRPGTLFRALILSEFVESSLREAFYQGHDLHGTRIADPFMGGGTPLLEANRLGCDVVGYDINPMSHWIVSREIEHLDVEEYSHAGTELKIHLESEIGPLYRTKCLECGHDSAHVKYFLWVKTIPCDQCENTINLFPGYLIAKNIRHTAFVILCRSCLRLNEIGDRRSPGFCRYCNEALDETATANHNLAQCRQCGAENRYPRPEMGPPQHQLFAIEYHCPCCRSRHKGRYFKSPDADDHKRYSEGAERLSRIHPKWIPSDEIQAGDESDRLHRWGYRHYREMFNDRQLLGLELSARWIMNRKDDRIRKALGTNLSDLLRYQNMLCRYDPMALKSLDIFSVHGFPVGLIECESNLLGIPIDNGRNVGSGGWSNIIEKYRRAKLYCNSPFEIRRNGSMKKEIPILGETITDIAPSQNGARCRSVELNCASATMARFAKNSLDGIFTDPPYFGNVQYAELMDFCYVWLRRMFGETEPVLGQKSTRNDQEFTVNRTRGRGIEHFTAGMASAFSAMVAGLKSGAPFVFTYHHNKLDAYLPLAIAILDSGLVCSAVFPCPAEMGGSIHINGTESSIVDSVFVCRVSGVTRKHWIVDTPKDVANLVREDVAHLQKGNLKATKGDMRCLVFGHLIRLAVWSLRNDWNKQADILAKLRCVRDKIATFGGFDGVVEHLSENFHEANSRHSWTACETPVEYDGDVDYVSF